MKSEKLNITPAETSEASGKSFTNYQRYVFHESGTAAGAVLGRPELGVLGLVDNEAFKLRLQDILEKTDLNRVNRMSDREKEVMISDMQGKTSKQIGEELGLSFKTVEIHKYHIEKKLGTIGLFRILKKVDVNSARELINAMFAKAGLVKEAEIRGEDAGGALELKMKPNAKSLTEREKEVLDFICDNLSSQEIADKLIVSVRTVESHVGHIHAKEPDAISKARILAGKKEYEKTHNGFPANLDRLSSGQRQVHEALGIRSLEEVAEILFVSPRTIEFHVDEICKKFNIVGINHQDQLRAILSVIEIRSNEIES